MTDLSSLDPAPFTRVTPTLDGVPETLLWPLRSRAGVSVLDRAFFDDPLAVDSLNRLDYDFARFGPVNHWHAVRSKYSDELIRAYLAKHPNAQVLALGEGLETQLWRVDNGSVRWLCVDLPESIALRRVLLPEHPRLTELPLSALDPSVFDSVDATDGLFVTAAGLLMYFEPEDVTALVNRIAANTGDIPVDLFFDAIPHWLSRRTLKGWHMQNGYVTPPMPFGLTRKDLPKLLGDVPGLSIVEARNYGDVYPDRNRAMALAGKVPVVRDLAPLLIHGRFQKP
ncbi:MAG: class I SAM-dependent methyltransferase [Pseudomonadota bacterium]